MFAPINPTAPAPAEEACVKLTEDDDVFLVTGFFLNDAVLCPVSVHETAVVGGSMTTEWLDQAAAPWVAWEADTDLPEAIIRSLDEKGELDGNVAVFSNARDQAALDEVILPTLADLGVEPVETGIVSAPADDAVAMANDVQTIGERFEAADADTILIVGASGQDWPTYMNENTSYRPKLLFLDPTAPRAFYTNEATTDTSILDGSLSGGRLRPADRRSSRKRPCRSASRRSLTRAWRRRRPRTPATTRRTSPSPPRSRRAADVALISAVLEAAGEDLNYGTFEAAIDGLELTIPGDPTRRTYGPPPDADGDPVAYLFVWDEATKGYVPVED